jgi:uncharacterized protein
MKEVLSMSEQIPLPAPTELTKPFWKACNERRLTVPRCERCGRRFFRPEWACTHCGSTDWHWVDSSGRGVLYSYTTVFRAPSPAFVTPYVLATIDLDDGYSMFSNVVDCPPDQVRIGMRLQVVFRPVRPDVLLPMFAPFTDDSPRG